ncbi:MAG: hypothetical protein QOG44_99 [Acidimicrobiaceae bacterium]|nr:hypothetical protein [Acidimicrobiaceae bacterium]
MVPANLRNDDAEALILDIRACRNAATQEVGDRPGGFLVFPTSVVTVAQKTGQSVFPLLCDLEPGALVTAPGVARISGLVAGVTVTGTFHWSLGEDAAPPASYRFQRNGRDVPPPPWAGRLPASQHLPGAGPPSLARQKARIRRRGRDAEYQLLTLTEQAIRGLCRGPIAGTIRYRPQMDIDDVVQRGLQAACRLLPVYASKDRPPCSWLGMLRLDSRRDMHREISRLDWLPADASAALTLADAAGVSRQSDPSATMAELVAAAERVGRSVPRITATALDVAMRAPALLLYEVAAIAAAGVPGPDIDVDDSGDGVTAATVARLVTNDAELIALARAGDPRALNRVGAQIVRRLGEPGESQPQARRRCWEHFQRSGELFASPTGLERFRCVSDAHTLGALDKSLGTAAGLTCCRADS